MKKTEYQFDPSNFINEEMLLCKQMGELDPLQKLKTIGYGANEKGEKKRFSLDPTIFAQYMEKCLIGKLLETGDIGLYRRKDGYYELVTDLILGKIIMALMSQCGYTLWKKRDERLVIEAYKRILNNMVTAFDSEDIINLKNGIYDLKTKSLLPHDPKHLCLGQVDTIYDPEAEAPTFKKFLNDISCGDQTLGLVMLQLIAYCSTRSIKAAKMFFLFGAGSNGKSVFVNILCKLVGQHNVASISLTDLSATSSLFSLEGLIGKYLNISAENEVEGKMKTENLKKLVTGDVFNVPRKYKGALQMIFRCKLIQVLNNLPDVTDMSYGFWRRVTVIPFNAKFEGSEIDIHMEDKLEEELSGILNLALETLEKLEDCGYKFSHCNIVEQETLKYELSQKPAWEFFCELYEEKPGNRIEKTILFKKYKEWSVAEGKEAVSVQVFWKTLKTEWKNKKIAHKFKKSKGNRYVSGFKAKSEFGYLREEHNNEAS